MSDGSEKKEPTLEDGLLSPTEFLLAIERVQRGLFRKAALARRKSQKNPDDGIASQNFLDASTDLVAFNQLLLTANRLGKQCVMLSGLVQSLNGDGEPEYMEIKEDPKKTGLN